MQNKKDGNSHKRGRLTGNSEDTHKDSIPVLENGSFSYDYKNGSRNKNKGTTNLTVKKEKHCGILKEKPPLYYNYINDTVSDNTACDNTVCDRVSNTTSDRVSNTTSDRVSNTTCDNTASNNMINSKNNAERDGLKYVNDRRLSISKSKPSLAVKISRFYSIKLMGCDLCREGISCSEGDEIKFSSEYCCIKEIETIFGILKLRRIFKDRTFDEQGYKYKTGVQLRLLNEILRITPYPNSQTLENLAVLLNLKPRSVQIWFQNARQGGDIQFSKDRLKGLRKSTSIDVRVILELFINVCYDKLQ